MAMFLIARQIITKNMPSREHFRIYSSLQCHVIAVKRLPVHVLHHGADCQSFFRILKSTWEALPRNEHNISECSVFFHCVVRVSKGKCTVSLNFISFA